MNQNLNNQQPRINAVPNQQQYQQQQTQGQNVRPPMPQNQNVGQFIKPTPQQPVKKKKKRISKELVTIIGVILIVGIIYFAYNYQLNKDLEITNKVPTAKLKISAGQQITAEDITTIDVPASVLKETNAIMTLDQVINKYVNIDTVIPEGSFFYSSALTDEEPSPDAIFKELGENQVAVTIAVDLESTYGNSIMPGNFVDIYVRANKINSKGNIEYLIGPLVYNAKVLAVKDSSGKSVFADKDAFGVPNMFIFGMDANINTIMLKAKLLGSTEYNLELFPVVNSKFDIAENETMLSQNEIKDLIENATVKIEDEE